MALRRLTLALIFFAASANAGVVQGVVLEQASGRPVSRANVRLQPLPKPGATAADIVQVRSGRSGQYVFNAVPPGSYLLVATRYPYFPAYFGQRLPAGRGKPIEVTADSTLFAELRFRHKGAITGRVLDENGVPAPGVPVIAYRARMPLRAAGSGTADDRGVYRVDGLEPGKYWIRSGTHLLDDGTGWQPTFGPGTREVRDARIHAVTVDADTAYADVSPEAGSLVSLGGEITCAAPALVTVTLSSETLQRRTQTFCAASPGAYRFDGLAPGYYEILAEAGGYSAFAELQLQRTMGLNLSLARSPVVDIDQRRATTPLTDLPVRLIARRQDLSQSGSAIEITTRRTSLAPGYWEIYPLPPPGWFTESVVSVNSWSSRRARMNRGMEWFEVYIEPGTLGIIQVRLNDRAGSIGGRVLEAGKPVRGIPVYLWPVAENTRRSLGGARELISDTEGGYRFENLPPGEYRFIASFDVAEMSEDLLEPARAPLVRLESGAQASLDLTSWTAPY